jgi:ABC-2 type transport system permease protein
LIRVRAVAAAALLTMLGLGIAAVWIRLGTPVRRRVAETMGLAGGIAIAIFAASHARASWDVSEDRANSLSRADEAALRGITRPLRIEAHLAPEDPRRSDLERGALSKLERVLPQLEVRWVSSTATGLFEQSAEGYGEIRYELDGRRAVSRNTTPEGVLDTIYELARVTPAATPEEPFRGHPLAIAPHGAAWVFFAAWPAVVGGAALISTRRRT